MRTFQPHNRVCKWCGVAFVTEGRHQRLRYCSDKCARASQSNTNRLPAGERQRVPVGRRFVRADDLAECVILADPTGLPYAEAIHERNCQAA